MSTSNGNPFASPAAEPQPSIATQYPMSGVDIMQTNFTGPQRALAAYRNGTARGGALAKPMAVGQGSGPNMNTGAIASGPQTMQAAPGDGGGYLQNLVASQQQDGGSAPRFGGPQAALAEYLQSGGRPASGGTGSRGNVAGAAGGNVRGMGAGRPRPPGIMRPTRM